MRFSNRLNVSPLSKVRHDTKGGQGRGASTARALAILGRNR